MASRMPVDTAKPQTRFGLQEFSGSLGDLGTFLPLSLAMAQICGVPLAASFLVAGIAHWVTALRYPIPIAVQPMKAIAALAIAGGLSAGTVYASGLIMAVLVLLIAVTGTADRLYRSLPLSLVRGLQLGIGSLLLWRGVQWLAPALLDFGASSLAPWVLAALAIAVAGLRWRVPAALLIMLAGTALVWPQIGFEGVALWWPSLVWPQAQEFVAALPVVATQLPTTLLNSVIAVVVLSRDLYPRLPATTVTPRGLCTTVGGLNIMAAMFGGLPLCHGSGGLAAQHRFGARSNGALWMLGGLKIGLALFAGATLTALVVAFPKALLGVLLLVSGLELIRVGLRLPHSQAGVAAFVVAAGVLLQQIVLAVVLGLLVNYSLQRWRPAE